MTESLKIDYRKLIPELEQWDIDSRIEAITSWTNANARFDHFVMYSRMIWPEFTEHDDCVFLAEGFSPNSYKEWRKQLNKTRTEAMLNHRHITDLFLNSTFQPTLDIVLYIGRYLKEVWTEKLKRDFPSRRFVVSFPEEPHTPEDLVSYEVSFFQNRE